MGAVLSSVTSPYDYKALDNSIFGAVFIICGVIGSIVISILIDRFHRFKLTFIALALVSVISLGLA
jgi:MFS family permease